MQDKDLYQIRHKMQGAQNLLCFVEEYCNPKATEFHKQKMLRLIKQSIPYANASMQYLRTYIPSSHFTNSNSKELIDIQEDLLKKNGICEKCNNYK